MIKLTRASATGNSFFISEEAANGHRSELAKKYCQNYVGFNTDGLIFLEKSSQADIRWDFYNADGSGAEMCGNGTRCVSIYLSTKLKNKKEISIETPAGVVITKVFENNLVETQMPEVTANQNKTIFLNQKKIDGQFINTGVPHFVIFGKPKIELAQDLRYHQDFSPSGANITFIEEISPGEVLAVTYERGVENFTLSCGTGAVAAGVAHLNKNKDIYFCHVEMPGGVLEVKWKTGERPSLKGPAQLEFIAEFYED